MGWFHSVLWGIDAQIEAVSESLLCVTPPMELLQARGWLLPLGDPCSVPVPLPASGIYQHHVASLRKGCSFPKLFNGSELISPGCCAPAVPQLCPQGLGDEFVSLQTFSEVSKGRARDCGAREGCALAPFLPGLPRCVFDV